MKSAICTLFEGSYHYGLAALTNSLHKNGFHGDVLAGYRGDLPPWAGAARTEPMPGWQKALALDVADGLRIVFLELNTDCHLTNYKPEFMLGLLDGPASDVDALFYLDPDICLTRHWRFFEEWVSCGVALCEDINSPLSENHPRRIGWRRYFGQRGLPLQFRLPQYVNGGCVGVRHADRAFLATWQQAMLLMSEEIGSLAAAKLDGGQVYRSTGFADCFDCSDQDALNAAIEATGQIASVLGQEAMAFKPGVAVLPHAVGVGKPWQRRFTAAALRGFAPRLADKAYWSHTRNPLASHGALENLLRRIDLTTAIAVGRLVRRS